MIPTGESGSTRPCPNPPEPGASSPEETLHSVDESLSPPVPLTGPVVEEMARLSGVAMLIGQTDTGKTTLCAAVALEALNRGRKVAIVDADAGQSEIGPPCMLGLGAPEGPFARLSDLKPRGLAFIGANSPYGYLLEWIIGTRRLVDRARDLGAELILLDTPGVVAGSIARRLQSGIAEAVSPSAIALLERDRELCFLRRVLPPVKILRPTHSSEARTKTATVRALRRAARYREYFEGYREWEIPLERLAIMGGSLLLGRPLKPAALETIQPLLRTRLLHVERDDEATRLITVGLPSKEEQEAVSKRIRGKLLWLDASRLKHLTVGLMDRNGETVGMGSLQRIDFRRRTLKVATPWLASDEIGGIIWGTARVSPDGREHESLRRGEV